MGNYEYKSMPESMADALEKVKSEQYAEYRSRSIGQFVSDHSGGANKMVDHVADVGNMAQLTIEQMRDMGGKPYWHVGLRKDSEPPHWAIMDPMIAKNIDDYFYGERWIAYAYPPANIDLEAWTAEWVDNDDSEEMMCKCSKCGYPVSYFWGKTRFCPGCGKAMTPEALNMLEKRLRGCNG